MDSEITSLLSLSEDYGKFAAGCRDRGIELHAPYGKHFKTRVPKNIMQLAYDPFSCDLVVAASGPEIYRLNLEEGVFVSPFLSSNESVHSVSFSPSLEVLLAGGDKGVVEVFDYRLRSKACEIQMAAPVTHIKAQEDGMQYLVGCHDGQVGLFDLRY